MKSRLTGLFSLLLFLAAFNVVAQSATKKPDRIHKLDQSVVEGQIDEVGKTEVLYRKLNDPKGPLYAIPRKEIWKIVWNNGDVEEINSMVKQASETKKPTDLLVKRKASGTSLWDNSGLYAGVQIGGGASLVPSSDGLESGMKPAFAGGISLGYHQKSIGIRLQANYAYVGYGVTVPARTGDQISSITGSQSQLMVPLTITATKKMGAVRVSAALGGFGVLQIGSGALKVAENGTSGNSLKNCESCYAKDLGYGVTGGIGVRLLEKATHALFVEATWYHNLGENKDYLPGEKSVNVHLGLLTAGILFHFPRKP